MTDFVYNSETLRWIHQWILMELDRNPDTLYTASKLETEWVTFLGYDMINKKKLYRALNRLDDAELVHVHVDSNENIEDGKEYQLNGDGRYYVSEMRKKLSKPPHFKYLDQIQNQEDRITELERQMSMQREFDKNMKEFVREQMELNDEVRDFMNEH